MPEIRGVLAGLTRTRALGVPCLVAVLLSALTSCGSESDEPGGTAGAAAGSGKGGSVGTGGNRTGGRPNAAGGTESGAGGDDAGSSGDSSSANAGSGGTDGSGDSGGMGAVEGGAAGAANDARFTFSIEPASVSLPRGASGWLTVQIARELGFDEPVTVRFENLPAGLAADTLVLPAAVDTGFISVSSSQDLAEGTRFELDAEGSSGSQSRTTSIELAIAAPRPSAQEAIRTALVANTVDYETSLLYRAYALTGDERLPDAFRGSGSEEEDNGLFVELRARLSELSSDAQAALRPYLVRPTAAESIWQAPAQARLALAAPRALAAFEPGQFPAECPAQSGTAGTWISKRSPADPIRVWAQCSGTPEGDAESVRLIDKTLGVLQRAYGPITTLMTAPLEDQGGADTAIDFYLVNPALSLVRRGESSFEPAAIGTTYGDLPQVGNATSAFVTLPRSLAYTSRFHTTVIHEFFHVVQKAYNATYAYQELTASNVYYSHWFPEASAVWAAAHFDRTLSPWEDGRGAYLEAHARFIHRFHPSQLALNALEPYLHTYAAYIWPYFVEQETDGASFMPAMWEGIASATTFEQADDAIDRAYSFRDHFKDFALRNLNMALTPGDPLPATDRYAALDAIFPDDHPPPFLEGVLDADADFSRAIELSNLGARYVRLAVDADVVKVELDFGGLQPAEYVDVQALVYTHQGGWVERPIDFSDEEDAIFCFDKGPATYERRGSFASMLLVLSNHAVRAGDRVSGQLVIKPSSEPCTPVWAGTITVDDRFPTNGGTVTETSSASVVFELDDSVPPTPFTTQYRLRSGTYSYDWLGNYTDRTPACRTREVGAGTMLVDAAALQSGTPNASGGGIQLNTFYDPVTFSANGLTLAETVVTSNCNDNNIDMSYASGAAVSWWETGAEQPLVSPDGATLEGTLEFSNGMGGTRRYSWLLTRRDE